MPSWAAALARIVHRVAASAVRTVQPAQGRPRVQVAVGVGGRLAEGPVDGRRRSGRCTDHVDLPSIGRAVQALIAVRIRPPSRHVIEAFRDWVTSLPQTLGVFVTTGTEDVIIHVAVAVADNDDLYAFVIDELTQRREVVDVRTSVVSEHIRSAPMALVPHRSRWSKRHHRQAGVPFRGRCRRHAPGWAAAGSALLS